MYILVLLNFTPLEFETINKSAEFDELKNVKFYSVGV